MRFLTVILAISAAIGVMNAAPKTVSAHQYQEPQVIAEQEQAPQKKDEACKNKHCKKRMGKYKRLKPDELLKYKHKCKEGEKSKKQEAKDGEKQGKQEVQDDKKMPKGEPRATLFSTGETVKTQKRKPITLPYFE